MANNLNETPVVLPLFDKLLQGDNIETDINADQAIRVARESVRRDLEILLNTRPRYLAAPSGLEELKSSLIAYGLPNLQTEQMATDEQQERFRRSLEAILRRFEPRLRELTVEIVAQAEATPDRTLRFRIYATLEIAATAQAVVYDTIVDPISGGISFGNTAT